MNNVSSTDSQTDLSPNEIGPMMPGGNPPPFVLENLPPHLRVGLEFGVPGAVGLTPSPATGNFRSFNKRRMIKRKETDPEPAVEGGTPLPFTYNSKDWMGKTPKSYVMEYFQRSNLQPPKWIRESHSTRQLHLIKVTFQDQTGKEVTLYADRYFRSVKDAEHNTSILVLCHLMPGAKDPKDIVDRMTQLQNLSKIQKRRRQETRPIRMGAAAYSFKNNPKMYSTRNGPQSLYSTAQVRGKGNMPKQYENYGYGYDYQQLYDPSTYAQDYTQLYNAYYQAGYGYDYSGYGATAKTTNETNTTATSYATTGLNANRFPEQTTQSSYSVQIPETSSRTAQDASTFNAQNWPYQDTTTSGRSSFASYPSYSYGQNHFAQAGYTSF
jgi:hypothetical protein